jgi:tRNA(Ile)-lysidine synthase
LLYADGQLLYAPGLGIDARASAEAGQAMLGLRWLPDGAAPA